MDGKIVLLDCQLLLGSFLNYLLAENIIKEKFGSPH